MDDPIIEEGRKSFIYTIIFICLALIIVTVFISFSKKVEDDYFNNQQNKTPSALEDTCTEGFTKKTGFNIFTCIDGEWIYTGNTVDDYKG